jgi:hypothetical protein
MKSDETHFALSAIRPEGAAFVAFFLPPLAFVVLLWAAPMPLPLCSAGSAIGSGLSWSISLVILPSPIFRSQLPAAIVQQPERFSEVCSQRNVLSPMLRGISDPNTRFSVKPARLDSCDAIRRHKDLPIVQLLQFYEGRHETPGKLLHWILNRSRTSLP